MAQLMTDYNSAMLGVDCPRCRSRQGVRCKNTYGKDTGPHASRTRVARLRAEA